MTSPSASVANSRGGSMAEITVMTRPVLSWSLVAEERERSYEEGYTAALEDILLFGDRRTSIYLDLVDRTAELPFEEGRREWEGSRDGRG